MVDVRKKNGKVRLRTLEELDGRTTAAQKARSLVRSSEADLGHDPSTGEKLLCQRNGLIACIIEDMEVAWLRGEPIDIQDYCSLVNAERRVVVTLGLKRGMRDVTPSVAAMIRG